MTTIRGASWRALSQESARVTQPVLLANATQRSVDDLLAKAGLAETADASLPELPRPVRAAHNAHRIWD
jgi:hypothetical protein